MVSCSPLINESVSYKGVHTDHNKVNRNEAKIGSFLFAAFLFIVLHDKIEG